MTTTTINPDVKDQISEENHLTNLQIEMSKMCKDLKKNVEKEHTNITAIYHSLETDNENMNRDSFISITERMLNTINKKEFNSYENKTIVEMLNAKMKEMKTSDYYLSQFFLLTPTTKKKVKELCTALAKVEDASQKKLCELEIQHIDNKEKYEFADDYDSYNSHKVKDRFLDNKSERNIPISSIFNMIKDVKENANDSDSKLINEEPELFAELNETIDSLYKEIRTNP